MVLKYSASSLLINLDTNYVPHSNFKTLVRRRPVRSLTKVNATRTIPATMGRLSWNSVRMDLFTKEKACKDFLGFVITPSMLTVPQDLKEVSRLLRKGELVSLKLVVLGRGTSIIALVVFFSMHCRETSLFVSE